MIAAAAKTLIGLVAAMRFWFPATLLILFSFSIIVVCVENVHGQYDEQSARNAEDIGEVKGRVDQIARSLDTMPEQMATLREKQGKAEIKIEGLEGKLNWILGLVASMCVALFGILVSEVIKWAKGLTHLNDYRASQ